jgi:hypothetical protein
MIGCHAFRETQFDYYRVTNVELNHSNLKGAEAWWLIQLPAMKLDQPIHAWSVSAE